MQVGTESGGRHSVVQAHRFQSKLHLQHGGSFSFFASGKLLMYVQLLTWCGGRQDHKQDDAYAGRCTPDIVSIAMPLASQPRPLAGPGIG